MPGLAKPAPATPPRLKLGRYLLYAEVAVEAGRSLDRETYSYQVPDGMDVVPGHRVTVPFGRRTSFGFVVSLGTADPGVETKPIASAVVVLTLINSWNSYLLPLVFLQDRSKQVVTLLPQFFVGEYTNDQTKILAAAVMTAIPTVLAYILLQKNFERGLSAGALK